MKQVHSQWNGSLQEMRYNKVDIEMTTLHQITENLTNQSVGITVGVTTVSANLLGHTPLIVNYITGAYFIMMIIHKGYQMHKEWRDDRKSKERNAISE